MSDPLSAAVVESEEKKNWVEFDEVPVTPAPDADHHDRELARDASLDVEDSPGHLESEHDRPAITPLPTQEFIADPAKLGSVPMVPHAMQEEFHPKRIQRTLTEETMDAVNGPKTRMTPTGIPLENSKILATIYPVNHSCAWCIPPRYDAYTMPSILATDGISVPSQDFGTAMEMIINDYRFRSFSTVYSRLIAIWMTIAITILLVVLFMSSEGGLPVMLFCLFWTFALFAGIIGCAIIRKQVRIGLSHCVSSANKILMRHGIIAGIEDKGQLSCHKVVIHLMWFRVDDCMADIERMIRIEASGGAVVYGGTAHPAPAKEMTKRQVEDKAYQLLLKYSQGYVKDTVKQRIIFPTRPAHGVSDYVPKHVLKQPCLCQYIDKEHFNPTKKVWYANIV